MERVAPKLKVASTGGDKEWRAHLLQTKNYQSLIETAFPEAKAGLDALYSELTAATELIKTKEVFINSQFDHRALEFRNRQEDLQKVGGSST